jgi:hypothetical protein
MSTHELSQGLGVSNHCHRAVKIDGFGLYSSDWMMWASVAAMPLLSEFCTNKTLKARFRPWLSGDILKS